MNNRSKLLLYILWGLFTLLIDSLVIKDLIQDEKIFDPYGGFYFYLFIFVLNFMAFHWIFSRYIIKDTSFYGEWLVIKRHEELWRKQQDEIEIDLKNKQKEDIDNI